MRGNGAEQKTCILVEEKTLNLNTTVEYKLSFVIKTQKTHDEKNPNRNCNFLCFCRIITNDRKK